MKPPDNWSRLVDNVIMNMSHLGRDEAYNTLARWAYVMAWKLDELKIPIGEKAKEEPK